MEALLFFIGLIILLAICWRYTSFSFYILIFLAPFLGLVVDFSQYSFAQKIPGLSSIQAPIADLLAIVLFLALILKNRRANKNHPWQLWLTNLKETGLEFFLPFLIINLVSLFNLGSDQLGNSFKYFLRPIVFFYLMWIVLPYFVITTKTIAQKTIQVIVGSGLAAAFWGIISVLLSGNNSLWKRITPGKIGGLSPLTYNHNILAEVLVLAVPLAFYFFLKNQKKPNHQTEKILFLSFLFLTLVALLTFSRAAWIALVFEIIVYWFCQKQKFPRSSTPPTQLRWKKAGIIVAFLLPVIIYMGVFSLSYVVKSSTSTRLDMTEIAWTYFHAHPLIGNGTGTFTQLIGDTRLFTVEYGDPLDSHGVIQKLLAETGALGLISFFIFVSWIISQLYQSAKLATEEKELKTLVLVSFLGCLVFQLFNTSYYNQHLWLMAGVGLAIKKVWPNHYL
ncbi:MAG TPA: O-antigen ligase family protein [Candidatus Magasanikbacteria bacterium]|nr:O-antigen ligase family protein [Candidatus Magasanikbacteria bacterium]